MNCEAVKEMLWAYLEKETTAEEAEKIEEHLAGCADCRAGLEAQKAIMDSLRSLPDEELPEGYHEELMQKLRAETAPNVVPFPQKKKKQPIWKQMSMIAAAVLVVVAAGGMNGMLEMRESLNAAESQMKAMDAAAPAEAPEKGIVVYDEVADVTEDYLGDMDVSDITIYSSKKQSGASAAGGDTGIATTQGSEPVEMSAYETDDAAAMPEAASAEEKSIPFHIARSGEVRPTDTATLLVTDMEAAKTSVQQAIAAVEGYEEAAEGEGNILAVIPVAAFEAFAAEMEGIGVLSWTQKGKPEEAAAWRTIEIQLKTK